MFGIRVKTGHSDAADDCSRTRFTISPTTCSGSISYARGRDNSAVHRLTITDNWQAFRLTFTDNRRTLDDNSAITTGSARMLR